MHHIFFLLSGEYMLACPYVRGSRLQRVVLSLSPSRFFSFSSSLLAFFFYLNKIFFTLLHTRVCVFVLRSSLSRRCDDWPNAIDVYVSPFVLSSLVVLSFFFFFLIIILIPELKSNEQRMALFSSSSSFLFHSIQIVQTASPTRTYIWSVPDKFFFFFFFLLQFVLMSIKRMLTSRIFE